MYEYLNTYLKRDLFSSYLKDEKFESKQVIDVSMVKQIQNINLFLEGEIERMQQQIDQNNQMIANYNKGHSKVLKK